LGVQTERGKEGGTMRIAILFALLIIADAKLSNIKRLAKRRDVRQEINWPLQQKYYLTVKQISSKKRDNDNNNNNNNNNSQPIALSALIGLLRVAVRHSPSVVLSKVLLRDFLATAVGDLYRGRYVRRRGAKSGEERSMARSDA